MIGNRMLFGGNLLCHPSFAQLGQDNPQALRVVGEMAGSNEIMVTTLFLGMYPGLTNKMLEREFDVINSFVLQQSK